MFRNELKTITEHLASRKLFKISKYNLVELSQFPNVIAIRKLNLISCQK